MDAGTPARDTSPPAHLRLASAGHLTLPLAAVLAGLAVLLDQSVVWAGQPSGDPTNEQVASWYDAHAAQVVGGGALWVAACGVLVAALWTAVASFPSVPRWTSRAVGLSATTALAASSLLAARITVGVEADALSGWHQESAAFRVGAVLLCLTMLPLLDGLLTTRRWVLAGATPLVALGLVVPALDGWAVAAVFALVAAILVVPGARVPDDAGPRDVLASLRHRAGADR